MNKQFTSVLLVLSIAIQSYAQDAPTMFAVYESHIKPKTNAAYVDAVKKLVGSCKQQKMPFSWTAGSLDDNSYVYIVPIKGFADLDKNMFADLQSKIGKEALVGLWQGIDKCVENQTSTVELYLPALSYLSPGPDDYYRNVLYWYPEVEKVAEAEALIAEWIKLFSSKKSPNGVQTYKTIFGDSPRYIFVSWGKNPVDYASKDQKANEQFGEEMSKLWTKSMAITRKYYTKVGWIQGDLSYYPAAK